jgi:tetratricopeptide (TPR) repeat protein
MIRAGIAAILLACAGCTTPYAIGERLYREGDRLGALETWRAIPEPGPEYDAAQARIAVVEDESELLIIRYKQRARYFEERGRTAESLLNYRLALKLNPDDAETLAHVQELARSVAAAKGERDAAYQAAFERGDLAAAHVALAKLRTIDPFDPGLVTAERDLQEALRTEVDRRLDAGRRGLVAGNERAARAAFRAVLALDPANESAQGYLSYIATIRREAAGAQGGTTALESTRRFTSDDEIRGEGFYQNALAAERRGDLYAAIRHDLRALRADREHPEARAHLLGLRARMAGRVDELIESGLDAFRAEDLQTALDLWRRAQLVDPKNDRARAYVKRAERQLQNLERMRADPDVAGSNR